MKIGDLIALNPNYDGTLGYELGLIIDECKCDTMQPTPICHRKVPLAESKFRVLWSCGRVTTPLQEYLEHFAVV